MPNDSKYLWGAVGVAGLVYWDHNRRKKASPEMYGASASSAIRSASRTVKSLSESVSADPCSLSMLSRDRSFRALEVKTPLESRRKKTLKRVNKLKKEFNNAYDPLLEKYNTLLQALGDERGGVDSKIKAIRTGDTSNDNLKMAHYLIYELGSGNKRSGEGAIVNLIEDKLGRYITPKLRRDVKAALREYDDVSTALDNVLAPLASMVSSVHSTVVCARKASRTLAQWSSHPVELVYGYCSEANGEHQGWINDRRQFFKKAGKTSNTAVTYGPSDSTTTRRRAWNKVCDRWVQNDNGKKTYFDWPRWNDPAWGEMPHVYRNHNTKLDRRGCLIGESCGSTGTSDVRSCIKQAGVTASGVLEFVADPDGRINTLFQEADELLVALRTAVDRVRTILWTYISIVQSTGFKIALGFLQVGIVALGLGISFITGGVGIAAGMAGLAAAGALNDLGKNIARSLKAVRKSMRTLKTQLNDGRSKLSDAQDEWNQTPWRSRVVSYMSSAILVADAADEPWQWVEAQNVCSTVFPRISDACMTRAIRLSGEQISCPRTTGSYVPKERLGPEVLTTPGPGGQALTGFDRTPTFETEGEEGDFEFSGYGALTKKTGFQLMSPVGIALVVGIVWLLSQETGDAT